MSRVMETQTEIPSRIARHTALPPAVSVIIPAYNVAKYIGEAVRSVLAQTRKDFEIIVINDGSPDTEELERMLEPFREHFVYIKQDNRGAAAARNAGLYVARGEFVGFLDADDMWEPDFLNSQLDFIANHARCDFVYADARLVGDTPLAGKTYMETTPSRGAVTFESLVTGRCNVITSGVVARRKVILDVGLFDEHLLRAHDFDLWLRMLRHGAHGAYQRKILLSYRVRHDSLSGNAVQRVERELEAYDKIERHLELTDYERSLIAGMVRRLNADLRIERGKDKLFGRKFDAAAAEFRSSYRFRRNWKLPLVLLALRVAPNTLLRVYTGRRMQWARHAERIKRACAHLISGPFGT